MIKRLLLTLAAVGTALVLLAAPASAQYEPDAGQTVSDSTVVPGQVITVSGFGCDPGSSVQITFDGAGVATTTANDDGEYSAQVTIPADASFGFSDIVSTCDFGDDTLVLTSTVEVVSPSGTTGTTGGTTGTTGTGTTGGTTGTTGTSGGVLPRTGSSSLSPFITVGIVMLTAGGLLLIGVRKRNQSLSHTA